MAANLRQSHEGADYVGMVVIAHGGKPGEGILGLPTMALQVAMPAAIPACMDGYVLVRTVYSATEREAQLVVKRVAFLSHANHRLSPLA